MRSHKNLRLSVFCLLLSAMASFAGGERELVFVGSGHKDITSFWFDTSTGALEPAGEVASIAAPSFLAVTPDRKHLYAVSEGGSGDDSFVSAFQIDAKTGKLTFINRQLSGGAGPCFVAVDRKGEDVLAANYNSGSVAVFPISGQGKLGAMSAFIQDHGWSVNPARQQGPHAHCIVTSPDDRFAFACDLGLDKVMAFKFDPGTGSLEGNDPAFASVNPGEGPRHIAFPPNGKFAYVINEMASTVTVFSYDRRHGVLNEMEEYSLLPKDFKGSSTGAEVAVHPSGKYIFASNRGDDSIVVFGCNPATGKLKFMERVPSGGKTPRHFEIEPSGDWLLAANQDSGNVVVFHFDTKTGHLEPVGQPVMTSKPMCIVCMGHSH